MKKKKKVKKRWRMNCFNITIKVPKNYWKNRIYKCLGYPGENLFWGWFCKVMNVFVVNLIGYKSVLVTHYELQSYSIFANFNL